jgi:hypothetical protein
LIAYADYMMHAQTRTKRGRARANKDRYPTVDPPGVSRDPFQNSGFVAC